MKVSRTFLNCWDLLYNHNHFLSFTGLVPDRPVSMLSWSIFCIVKWVMWRKTISRLVKLDFTRPVKQQVCISTKQKQKWPRKINFIWWWTGSFMALFYLFTTSVIHTDIQCFCSVPDEVVKMKTNKLLHCAVTLHFAKRKTNDSIFELKPQYISYIYFYLLYFIMELASKLLLVGSVPLSPVILPDYPKINPNSLLRIDVLK